MTPRSLSLITWFTSVLSGVLLACLFDPIAWRGAVWFALLPLIFGIWFRPHRQKKKRKFFGAFGRGYLAGVFYFCISLSWLAEVVPAEAGWIMNMVPTLAISLFLALYPGLWAVLIAISARHIRHPGLRESGKEALKEETNLQRKVRERLTEESPRKRKVGGRFAWKDAFSSLRCAAIGAAGWVVLEWCRGYFLTGFGWNSLGSAFCENLYLAQAADLVGEIGLSFVPVFMAMVLADTVRRLVIEAKSGTFRAHPDFAVGVLLIAMTFIYGLGRFEQVQTWPVSEVRVLGIQQNIPIDTGAAGLTPDDIYQQYDEATTKALVDIKAQQVEAIREGENVELWAPDWIIFPESALPFPTARDHQGKLSNDGQYNVSYYEYGIKPQKEILGPFTWITGVNERILSPKLDASLADYNSMWIVENDVKTSHNWGKKHLVPFGEYIPLREELPFLEKLFEKATAGNPFGGNFQRGKNQEPIKVDVGGREVGIIGAICYEDSVARVLRPYIRAGESQVIVNITNDGWFGKSAAALQHFATARFRAIEFRRPLVRVANTGVTAAVGIDGSLRSKNHPQEGERWIMDQKEGPFVNGALKATIAVPVDAPMTLYAFAGDWFVGFCLALVCFLLIPVMLRK